MVGFPKRFKTFGRYRLTPPNVSSIWTRQRQIDPPGPVPLLFYVILSMGKKKRSRSPSAKKHRGWTTEAQHELLNSYLPKYMVAKAKLGQKAFDEFWPPVHSEWFKRWPLPELTQGQLDKGMTMDKQLEAQKLVGMLGIILNG